MMCVVESGERGVERRVALRFANYQPGTRRRHNCGHGWGLGSRRKTPTNGVGMGLHGVGMRGWHGVGMGLAPGWHRVSTEHRVSMGLAWGRMGLAWGWHRVSMGLAWG
jgi:hypothetical protein